MDESISPEGMARRAKLRQNDDREEYKKRMKYGKNYKQFMSLYPTARDDREAYKRRMKYGKE